jgi:hypothetical protein
MATRFADQHTTDARDQRRTRLCLAAIVECGGQRTSVRIRDLSADGARIEASPPPPLQARLTLLRGPLNADAIVVWRDRDRCGLRFDKPIRLPVWLPNSDAVRTQDDIDQVVRDFHREQALRRKDRENPMLTARLADELAYVGRMVQTLQQALSPEPQIIAKHRDTLPLFGQALEALGQLGAILAADDMRAATNAIAHTSLGRRLLKQRI